MNLAFKASVFNDAGPKNNEDSCFVQAIDSRFIAVIADGVGSTDAGEIASGYVTKYIENWLEDQRDRIPTMGLKELKQEMLTVINTVHEELLDISEDRGISLGSTVTFIALGDKKCIVLHIGDSRAYAFNGREVLQMTIDQTVAEEERRTGIINPNIEESRKEHIIFQCVGSGNINPTIYEYSFPVNVDILLCTDGMSNTLSNEDLANELRKKQSGKKALRALTEKARFNGEKDNITGILIRRRTEKGKK